MKKFSGIVFVLSLLMFTALSAQVYTIDNFDSSASDTVYFENVEGGPSYIGMSDNHTDFVEGTGSMDVNYVIGEFHEWGSFANMIYRTDSTETLDWTVSDSLSIWIKIQEAPTHPEWMVFRIHIADQPTPSDEIEEYIYENAVVLDNQADWFELKIPLYERPQNEAGDLIPNDSGFVLFPTSWGGGTYNNHEFDRNKIIGYNLSAVVSGYTAGVNLPADSVRISFDNFTRFGSRAVPFIIFNGITTGSNLVNTWWWGQSSIAVLEDSGATPGTNVLKWTQGDEYGNGWTGFGFDVNPAQNMLGGWMTDSVKFKMKAGTSTGPLRIQFESGADGKVGIVFSPTADNQWHDYAFALKDFVFQDGTTVLDTTAIITVGMMAEASGVAGNVVYVDDWWTGNPDFDVIAPNAPSPVVVNTGTFANSVSWTDPESGATYDIYYSESPITDVNASGVQWGGSIAETPPSVFDHALFSPSGDSTVSYYYAVTATDEAGNVSDAAVTASSVTNTAKGIATISLNAPAGFAADGNLSEWSSVTPIILKPSLGAHIVTNQTVTDDNDLSVETYLAADNDYLYIAFDVTDDMVDTTAANSWEQDSPDLFIGLFDWHNGKPHGSYLRGSEPDYHFRFNHNQAILDNLGSAVVLDISSPNYSWTPSFPTGYIIEAKIAWSALAAAGSDDVFTPVEGYKIPIDLAINDADGGGVREGIMTLSPDNEDNSWQSPSHWVYTWIGNIFDPVVGIEEPGTMIYKYDLSQNYPNPFNPTTNIKYTLAKQSFVELYVYNTLGQRVQNLVQRRQAPGTYFVQFDGRNLASGIYFYRLKADDFVQIRKMVLMK
jgi:hypothetical protein